MLKQITILCLIAAFAAIFYFDPTLDLKFSSLFYKPGEGFYMKDELWVRLIYRSAPVICSLFIVAASIAGLRKFIQVKSFNLRHYKKIIYVTLVCLLGPGLLVHTVFKDHFGRPRPHQVEQFGGNAHFQRPYVISNECAQNCSFPSGHASVGYMLFAVAFLYTGWKRISLSALAIFLGLGIGLARVIQGGHFLSDIIFAGSVVYIVADILDLIIKPRKN